MTTDPSAGLYIVECSGAPDATIVQTFSAVHLGYEVPLRCGGGYGYRHIHERRGGFGHVLEAHISSCLANPVTPIELQGTTLKYNCYVVPSDYGMEVYYGTAIVQTAPYQDGQPKGSITYYEHQLDLGDV